MKTIEISNCLSVILLGLCLVTSCGSAQEEHATLWEAIDAGSPRSVKALIAAGADVNEKNEDGLTPLIKAAFGGHTEIVKLLLAKKPDIDSNPGGTALMTAAFHGHVETVKTLLDAAPMSML